MPTYQYSCTECGHFFEQHQSFSEDSLTVCPQCSGALRKVFNAVGVVFKGSGFYRTDSRSTSAAADPPRGSSSAPASAGSASEGSATKAATKSESAGGSGSSGSSSSGGSSSGSAA